ncbi:MATE family efflux transporter [bacterium]|nr:MATE family efflux transporter [bacterium]
MLKETLRLAIPVAFSHLLIMTMGLVDLIYMREVGTVAAGAIGIAVAIVGWTLTVGLGLLAGLDYFIATAHGSGDRETTYRYLGQGIWLALATGVPCSAFLYFGADHLALMGITPDVAPIAASLLKYLAPGMLPLFLFGALRGFLQATSRPLPPMLALLAGNFLNVLFNYMFIFGHYGAPALGARGSAVATTLCRFSLAVMLVIYVLWDSRKSPIPWPLMKWNTEAFFRLFKLGLPASLQMMVELGVFGLSTVLAGNLTANALAAHQIVLNMASAAFMVPLGIGAACAVLVGQSIGAQNPVRAAEVGWLGLKLATGFMTFTALLFFLIPNQLLSVFTQDPVVIEIAMQLILVAAIFQIADGAQTSLTGSLRGLGDTTTAAVVNFIGHWLIGLPISLALCFSLGWGVLGIWVGLAAGLFVVACWLLYTWAHKTRKHPTPVL